MTGLEGERMDCEIVVNDGVEGSGREKVVREWKMIQLVV